jgi:hypothetical protein
MLSGERDQICRAGLFTSESHPAAVEMEKNDSQSFIHQGQGPDAIEKFTQAERKKYLKSQSFIHQGQGPDGQVIMRRRPPLTAIM